MSEKCSICGCHLHRKSETYALPTAEGRSHASKHHFVAERFYGRSGNRRGTQRDKIFPRCTWGVEGETTLLCYDCHEELLHNPIFLPEDIESLATLVKRRGLQEDIKTESKDRIAGRIMLLHEIIQRGILELKKEPDSQQRHAQDRQRTPVADQLCSALATIAEEK